MGIPDITTIVKRGAYQEAIIVPSKDELNMTFNEKILDLTSVVKKAANRVCVCTIAPMDIEKWNKHRLYKKKTKHLKHQANYKEMQNTLEEAIIQINKFIVEIDMTDHMITPFIADTVFTKKRIPKQKILLQTPWWASPRGRSLHQMGRANSTKNRCQLLSIHERCHSPAASNMKNKKGNSWGRPLPQSVTKEGVENLLRVNWVWPCLSRPDRESLTGYT